MNEHTSAYFLERPGYTMKMRMAYVTGCDKGLHFIMDIRDTIGTCQLQLVDTDLDELLARVNETLGRSPYV